MDHKLLLTEIRSARGWSQHDLAKALGIGQTMVSSVERGIRKPSVTLLYKINELHKKTLNINEISQNNTTAKPVPASDREFLIEAMGELKVYERICSQFFERIENVLSNCEGVINKGTRIGNKKPPGTHAHQVSGGL